MDFNAEIINVTGWKSKIWPDENSKRKKIAVIAAKNRKSKSFAVVTAKLDNNVKRVYNGVGDEKWL